MLLQRKGMAGAINQAKNSEFGKSQTPRLESTTIDLLNGGSINLTLRLHLYSQRIVKLPNHIREVSLFNGN